MQDRLDSTLQRLDSKVSDLFGTVHGLESLCCMFAPYISDLEAEEGISSHGLITLNRLLGAHILELKAEIGNELRALRQIAREIGRKDEQ